MGNPNHNDMDYHLRMGFLESLFQAVDQPDGTVGVQPMLAVSWNLDQALEFVDIKLREGVQFHKGYGELTAEDVAWTFDQANAAITPGTKHDSAGDNAVYFSRNAVIDRYTVRMYFNNFNSNYLVRLLSTFWEGNPIYSKAVFDKYGLDGMADVFVGTGPFQVKEYVRAKWNILEAYEDHWRNPPYVKTLRFLEVPEAASRMAMLKTGEAAIATELPLRDWPSLFAEGFKRASVDYMEEYVVTFSGNYWEKTHVITGEPLSHEGGHGSWT